MSQRGAEHRQDFRAKAYIDFESECLPEVAMKSYMSRDLVRYTSRFCIPLFGALLSLLFILIDGMAPAGRSVAKIEGVDPRRIKRSRMHVY